MIDISHQKVVRNSLYNTRLTVLLALKGRDYNIQTLTPNNEVFEIKFSKILVISVKLAENLDILSTHYFGHFLYVIVSTELLFFNLRLILQFTFKLRSVFVILIAVIASSKSAILTNHPSY